MENFMCWNVISEENIINQGDGLKIITSIGKYKALTFMRTIVEVYNDNILTSTNLSIIKL